MTESLRDYLARREGELEQRIATLESEVAPLRAELAEVLRARDALYNVSAPPSRGTTRYSDIVPRISNSPYQSLTLKQLVRKALSEHFVNGATAIQLIEHFSLAWGREIPRASLSPQLSRLKEEGEIDLNGKIWTLVKKEESSQSNAFAVLE